MYGIHICKTIIVDLDQSWFRLSPFRMCTRCFNVTNEFMLLVLSSCFIVFTSLQMYPEQIEKKKKKKGQRDARDRKERFILSSFNSYNTKTRVKILFWFYKCLKKLVNWSGFRYCVSKKVSMFMYFLFFVFIYIEMD